MRKQSTLTIIILFFFVQISFAQSKKTFVKSLAAETKNIVLNLPGNAEVIEWNEQFVRVTTTIIITNFSEDILKRLFAVGRYSLISSVEQSVMTLNMPKIDRKVSIKGVMLNEILSYKVFVPAGSVVTKSSVFNSSGDFN